MILTYFLGPNNFLKLYIFLFHISLLFYSINILTYTCCILSGIHYYIHTYKNRKTIVETKKASYDEIWHLINQLLVFYYIYKNDLKIKFYLLIELIYFTLLIFSLFNKNYIKVLYYFGATLAVIFMLVIDPLNIFVSLFLLSLQMIPTWLITSKNKKGRLLIKMNAAGCAFISESLILYYITNKLL
jgi:hypothetical protein